MAKYEVGMPVIITNDILKEHGSPAGTKAMVNMVAVIDKEYVCVMPNDDKGQMFYVAGTSLEFDPDLIDEWRENQKG